MPVDLKETRLPGVGVKYGFRTSEGGRLAIVLHNDGMREIYFFRHEHDDEPSAVIRLDDDEARQLGAVIGGAYERPKIVEELELALGELTIEWVPVPEDSPLIGKTLAECGFRAKTGITVIAILPESEPVAGAQPTDVVEKGDTLVTVGKLGQYAAFRKLLAEGTLAGVDVLCSAVVAAVRSEPREDAERVTELLQGEPVEVEERRDGWARIRTAYDYPGWVHEGDLGGLDGDAVEQARRYLGAPICGAA